MIAQHQNDAPAPNTAAWSASTRLLLGLARTDVEKFTALFRKLRQIMPEEITRACIRHLATHDIESAEKQMLFWLSLRNEYFPHLLHPEFLQTKDAKRAAIAFRGSDPYFFSRLLSAVSEPETPSSHIRRVLSMLSGLGDYSALLPWLRNLMNEPDEIIRSQAAKLICGLRPNRAFVERQMQVEDGRVRANAIEALWHVPSDDATAIFHMALDDSHHRVVANALLGLFYQNNLSALDTMLKHAMDDRPLTRAAMAWALGETRDRRALAVLKKLAADPVSVVANQAAKALSHFGDLSELGTPDAPPADIVKPEEQTREPLPPASSKIASDGFVPGFCQL
ncbi:MAG: HEAT repeat domain-containing protein [Acidobacteriota bacterium]|nr:HEAT repeat domain-containing protein [Acidobacteriota bacterium]